MSSHALSLGDTIAIGSFAIRVLPISTSSDSIVPPGPPRVAANLDDDWDTVALVPRVDEKVSRSAASVGAFQLNAAVALQDNLLRLETERERQEALCSWLVDSVGATQAQFVRLRGEATATILCGATAGGSPSRHLSRTLLHALWHRRELITGASSEQRGEDRRRVLLACPVRKKDRTLDAVYVELGPELATEEWRALVDWVVRAYLHAGMAARVSRERQATAVVEHELKTAHELQHQLLAKLDTCPEGLDVIIEYQPCLWVGGDYVDAVTLPNGRALLVTADVCGKGLEGAMVASSLHTLVRATVDSGEPLASLIDRMNRYLCSYLPDHSYVTIVAVTLDPSSGRFECINAGHPPAMVCGEDGTLRRLQSGRNVALGMWPTTFDLQEGCLGPGEILIFYTDGLSEAQGGERDPTGRALWEAVARIVRAGPIDPFEGLADELRRRLSEGRDGRVLTDDAAFLLARWRDGPTAVHEIFRHTNPGLGQPPFPPTPIA